MKRHLKLRRKLNENPRKKWYVGVIGHTGNFSYGEIFSSEITPVASTHGDKYLYVIGPEKTYKDAVNAASYVHIVLNYKR